MNCKVVCRIGRLFPVALDAIAQATRQIIGQRYEDRESEDGAWVPHLGYLLGVPRANCIERFNMCDGPNGFLVLDTNVWVYKTQLLRTGLGAALLYSIRQTKIALALPEVIELEIRKHVVKRGGDAVASIQEEYRLIEQLMGIRDDYQVPSIEAFAQQVDIRLTELEGFIVPIPFTVQHAKDALTRVIEESLLTLTEN